MLCFYLCKYAFATGWWYHHMMTTATAQAAPNIAFIKYWGNRDNALRIPVKSAVMVD